MLTLATVRSMLYPNWFNVAFFTQSWGLFFSEEIYSLGVFIGAVFLWHYFVAGFSFWCVLCHVLMVVGIRRVMAGGLCTSTKRLDGQTVIITGANVGIGKETARDLLRRGARVILACRDLKKAEDARQELRQESSKVEARKLDLSSLQSVRDFVNGIIKDDVKVHILINNAGVMMCPYMETAEGFELQMGTNHLGHFLLTNLLLPQMKHGEPARIVTLASLAHLRGRMNYDDFNYKAGYNKIQAYGNSKLANVLFTRQLAKELKGSNIEVFSVHPGAVYSNLARHLVSDFVNNYISPLLLKTTLEGAQTTIYCCTEARQSSEMYFSDCAVGWASNESKDDASAEQLWKLSSALVQLGK